MEPNDKIKPNPTKQEIIQSIKLLQAIRKDLEYAKQQQETATENILKVLENQRIIFKASCSAVQARLNIPEPTIQQIKETADRLKDKRDIDLERRNDCFTQLNIKIPHCILNYCYYIGEICHGDELLYYNKIAINNDAK